MLLDLPVHTCNVCVQGFTMVTRLALYSGDHEHFMSFDVACSLTLFLKPSEISGYSFSSLLSRHTNNFINEVFSWSSLSGDFLVLLEFGGRYESFERVHCYHANGFPCWFHCASADSIWLHWSCACNLFDMMFYRMIEKL